MIVIITIIVIIIIIMIIIIIIIIINFYFIINFFTIVIYLFLQVSDYCQTFRSSSTGDYRIKSLAGNPEIRFHAGVQKSFKTLQVRF